MALFRELGPDRELAWKAGDVLMALGLQAVLFVIDWVLAGRGRVAAVLGAALAWVPTAVANLIYMAVVPAFFLLETDVSADVIAWKEECDLPGTRSIRFAWA